MVDSETFYNALQSAGIDFFAGVPDSLLGPICACISDKAPEGKHHITANEGAAVAMATGWFLGNAKPAMVYMQNSGLGNAVNPLLSLADDSVYGIPMLIMIGWRGEPGIRDEPQHLAQGAATMSILESMGISYHHLPGNTAEAVSLIHQISAQCVAEQKPVALLVSKNAFTPYPSEAREDEQALPLSREQAIAITIANIDRDSTIVSSTGMISRELYELREQTGSSHDRDFLTVGSMGHCSQIALGVALAKTNKKVFCLDGDGAALMHMGSIAIIAQTEAANLTHIILNNASHGSVGGQPTCGFKISFPDIAKACGYVSATSVSEEAELVDALQKTKDFSGPSLIEIKVHAGNRDDLGRPGLSLKDQKEAFMKHLGN